MIKITINWDAVSPFLQTISGILIIEDINIQNEYHDATKILTCTVNSSNNPRCTGFGSIEGKGYSSEIFKKYQDTIDIMVDSYFRGLLLKETDYVWID
jgi:hypothetical protein